MTYKTQQAANNNAPHPSYNPALVRLADGTFDTYPAGHPLPAGAVIVSRKTANGWKAVA